MTDSLPVTLVVRTDDPPEDHTTTFVVAGAALLALAGGAWWWYARRKPFERAAGCRFLVRYVDGSVALARRLGEQRRDPPLAAQMGRDLAGPGCELDHFGAAADPESLRFRFLLVRAYFGGAVAARRIEFADALTYLAQPRADAKQHPGFGDLPEGI